MKGRLIVMFACLAGVCPAGAGVWPEAQRESRPWAYNWWMGSAVDEAGLSLQIAEMKRVGMGGFHVIPIYSVKGGGADRALLSPEWMRAFGRAVELAGKAGLGVDLTTGSGWCFGGPQLKPGQGGQMLEVNTKRPAESRILWRGKKDGRPIALSVRSTGQQVKRAGPGGRGPMMNPLSASAMKSFLAPFSAAFDAPGAPKPGRMYHDSYEYFCANWSDELPAAFAKRRGYRIEDHYAELAGVGDPETVRRVKCDYRETISEMIVDDVFPLWTHWCRARGIGTRNEAHGAPANLLDFYALADVPETEMFGCDRRQARQPSVCSRFMNSGDRDILVSKFASSAAHVRHLGAARDPLVSAEGCTWVCEHFCETLGAVKTFVDRLLLSGVNHLFYHGSCYSPTDAKWPGWTFYATCEMNRFNPIWRDADLLNRYVTRVQSVARSQAIDNDLLVYWPLHDFWMDADGFEKPLSVHARDWLSGQSVGRISRRLLDDGYAFDFISERQLFSLPPRLNPTIQQSNNPTIQQSPNSPPIQPSSNPTIQQSLNSPPIQQSNNPTIQQSLNSPPIQQSNNPTIQQSHNPYRAIVVPGAKAMKPETFARLVALSGMGYAVLFVDGFPTTVPGWRDYWKREAELKRLVGLAEASVGGVSVGRYEDLMAGAPVRREPFNKANGLAYTRHAGDGEVTYFIANQFRDAGVKGWFAPASPCVSAELWDPMTDEIRPAPVADGKVELELPIGHSVIVKVYDAHRAGNRENPQPLPLNTQRPAIDLRLTDWTRTPVAGGPEFPPVAKGSLPLPWGGKANYPESAFCGTMRYETVFEIADGEKRGTREACVLDLGRVEQSAKVFVNGRFVGGVFLPPYRVKIPENLIVSGTNTLAVEVTSTGANRLRWLDAAKPYPWKVFTDINMVNIDYRPLDASKWEPCEYGLFGPVTLWSNVLVGCAARSSRRTD